MYLKNKNQSPSQDGFSFYYEDRHGEIVRVPEQGKKANGVAQLTKLVESVFRQNGMEIPPRLPEIIEHQICLRLPDGQRSTKCFNGGWGDKIHQDVMKPLLKSIGAVATKVGLKSLGKAAVKKSGCSSCGGSKIYVQGQNNLGRADTLNKLGNKFAANADYKYKG